MVVDSTISAPGEAYSRTPSWTRLLAQTTTSASPMSREPRIVSRSGEPGPAPINQTLPPIVRTSHSRLSFYVGPAPVVHPLAQKDPAVASVVLPVGLLEPEPSVERQVLPHLLVGVQPDLRQVPPRGHVLHERHQPPAESLALPVGPHGHAADEQVVPLRPDLHRSDQLLVLYQDVGLARLDRRGVVPTQDRKSVV